MNDREQRKFSVLYPLFIGLLVCCAFIAGAYRYPSWIILLLPMGLIILGGIIGNCRVNRWSDFFIAMFTIALFEGFGLATAFAIGVKDSKSDNNGMVFMMIPPTLLISAPLIGLGLMIGWKLRLEKRTSKRT